MMKKIDITIFFSLFWVSLFADNILVVGSNSAAAEEQTTIEISIDNDDAFVAFQVEIPLPDQLEYVNGSIAIDPDRANGHEIAASIIDGNTLLIFAWSSSNTSMNGDSGTVASFELLTGTVPGTYNLNPQNVIIGNASGQNMLTGSQSGSVTIQCPDIHTSASSLDFGEVIIGNNSSRSITIYNNGNLPLNISDITFNDPAFSVTGNTSFTVNAGNQQSVTIQFDAASKGTYDNIMQIHSDDPDEEITQIALQAYAYAVNEIHTGNMFGYSGNTATLSFSINNMEPFVGFQFDLALPSPLSYQQGSAILSDRKTDHVVAVNMVSGNELRVVAWSPNNQSFYGIDGDILTLEFSIDGTGGFYSLNINDVIIADVSQGNIMSDYFNGQLEVAAPDIHCNTSLNFGEVAINTSDTETLRIYNYGSDTLKIQQVNFTNDAFGLNTSLPIEVLVGDYYDIELNFQPEVEGNATSQMQILSNDPDEYPKNVNLSANAFMPNYLSISSIECGLDDHVTLAIEAENYEEFVGFQFVLQYPDFMSLIPDSVSLTERSQDHQLITSQINPQELLVFSYSPTQKPFLGDSGAILKLQYDVYTTQSGTFPINLESPILGNKESENILYDHYDGNIVVNAYQKINISSGWSGISSYIIPENSNLEQLFSDYIDHLIILQDMTGVFWPDQSINTLGNWDHLSGYKIKMDENVLFEISGEFNTENTITLNTGWNLVPVPSLCNQAVAQTLNIPEIVIAKEIAGNGVYWPQFSINTLGVLQPGKSYLIFSNSETTITYPDCEGMKYQNIKPSIETLQDNIDFIKTPITHTIAIPAQQIKPLKAGSLITAVDLNENCFGKVTWDGENKAITLFGDDPLTCEKDGFYEDDKIHFNVSVNGVSQKVITTFDPSLPHHDGRFHENGISAIKSLNVGSTAIEGLPKGNFEVYPNPADETLNVCKGFDGDVKLSLININGVEVYHQDIGVDKITIDVSKLPGGIYFVKTQSKKATGVKRVVIK